MAKKENKSRPDKKDASHAKNWRETTASVEDIQHYLNDHVMLRYNIITRRVECHLLERSPWESYDGSEESAMQLLMSMTEERGDPRGPTPILWRPITDRIVNSLWKDLAREKTVRIQDIYHVLESDFVPEYHPFRYYLERLPPWDGNNHILSMSASVMVKGGVDEQLRFYEYLRKWLVGMVAGWIDDTVVNNVILVLIGEQGSYKTTWFNYLLPPELKHYFYTKTNSGRMGRDDLLTLAQYGLVCCEELDTMRPSELNQLKAAVTMPSIDERAAYAHFHEHRPHIASFCGTGNNVQFLSDATGNRRWLPFEVESITSPRDSPFDYPAIYAEAYALYRQGFRYWFSQQEIRALGYHNETFEAPQMERELISKFFRPPKDHEPAEFYSATEIFQTISGNLTQKLNANKMGRVMTDLGFKRVRSHGERGYLVVAYSAEEIKARKHILAYDARHTDEAPDDASDGNDTTS